ncbi:STAS domain-containing protein [Alkalicoccobacillus murimartini]|uniref:RsbT co-antagonist protein RsbR n=1 Tax=Alkalicoccobacillus murimartini TaxID=171685 RepID=A0ABT9YKY1_9BACI|nr:STAS domain-containing protein [Alkalicoccobacillus murimartini]MDQ0208537.1 rsbT co-antagonist protein RsbR [Alkalicoccobacillus murimartini]
MPKMNQSLYDFLESHAEEISEKWFKTLEEEDVDSVYSVKDEQATRKLIKQNNDFIHNLNNIFTESKGKVQENIFNWINLIGDDKAHLQTPLHQIFREFVRTRDIYLSYLNKFVEEDPTAIPKERADEWRTEIVKTLDFTIHNFIKKIDTNTTLQLEAQKEMINELSSPVILLQDNSALLPLVGDIDTARAKSILENTLSQCATKGVDHLYLDLSGVVIIDTMVANEIFQLISALSIIGVRTTLSGIRPEIAQTAVQLGLSFEKINIKSTLAQALASS